MTGIPYKSVKPTPEIEAFYIECAEYMRKLCDEKYKTIRNMEVIAALGIMTGSAISMCFRNERDLMRQLAIENIDRRIAELGPILDEMSPPQPPTGRA